MMDLNFKHEGFYRGVVEDNKDPLKQNRIKIRIHGVHTEDLQLNVDKLPWCEQANGLFCGTVQGVGVSSVPVQGSWVWVFFEAGNILKPVYFATTVGGKYEELPKESSGFRDKDLYDGTPYKFPTEERMLDGDNDVNRLSSNENINETIHQNINNEIMTNNDKSLVDITEPSSTNDLTEYPYNNVIESRCGHIIELDDTPDNERVRIYHKSGTYEEIKLTGERVVRNSSNSFIITKGDLKELVDGAVQRYISSNIQEHIKGNLTLKVDGNLTWDIGGNINISGGGSITTENTGTNTITSGGNFSVGAPTINLN